MRTFNPFLFFFSITLFCVLISFSLTQAQNSLIHNTGTLEVTIIDNGYIGDDGSGTYGGVVFNGNQNAMYTCTIMFGQNGEGFGNFGAWLIEDIFNVIPIAGLFPIPNFDQYSYYTVALVGNPDSRTMVETFSETVQDFVLLRCNISNDVMTIDDLHPGIFADWDVGNFLDNRGGYDPSRNLFYMYENGGGIDASYYGIMGIAVDDAAMAPNTMTGTITTAVPLSRPEIYDLMTSTAFAPITIDGDYRMFISLGPYSFSPGSTLVVDLAIVAGTSLTDLQDNADAAIAYGVNVPVELTSFTATSHSGKVYLDWATATEINNHGFEIERKIVNVGEEAIWMKKGFIEGYGTTIEPKVYSFVDDISNVSAISIAYRLKQIDFDGSFEYSDEVLIELSVPVEFALEQNYPNPFNPSTTINYQLPVNGYITIKLYDVLGSEVVTLVNEEKAAGIYEVEFNAGNLSSGVYFYTLRAGSLPTGKAGFIDTKKMVLMK